MIETLLRQRSPSASIPGDQYLAVGMNVSPWIAIYKKNGDTFTRLPTPATTPTGIVFGVAWNGNTHLACSHSNYPYVTIYKRAGDTFTKLADFTTNEGALQGGRITFNSSLGNGAAPASKMAYIFSGSPGFKTVSVSGDTFSVDANSATTLAATPSLNTGIAYNVNSGSGNYLAIAKQGIFIYSTANPPVRITQSMATSISVRCVATNLYDILLSYGDSSLIRLAATSAGPTFSAYSPSSLSTTNIPRAMAWDSYDAQYLAHGLNVSPFVKVYYWDTGSGFTACTLSSNPPGETLGVAWNYSSNLYLACCGATSPYVYIYKRNSPGGTSLTRLSDPAVLPEGQGNSVAFSEPI